MKAALLLLLVIGSFGVYAQDTLHIHLDNPAPRVGDEVKIRVSGSYFIDQLKDQLPAGYELGVSDHFRSNDLLTFTRTYTQAGSYTIGPFKFTISGQEYVTNQLEVSVAEALPRHDGLWVRYVRLGGKHYLVVEQLIANISNQSGSGNSQRFTLGGVKPPGAEFAKLKDNAIEGVSYNFSQSTTSNRSEGFTSGPGYSYSYTRYTLDIAPGTDSFKITKKDFTNFPSGAKFKPLLIQL